jgi:tRNA(Ile)-lysidine synthetase-like protein
MAKSILFELFDFWFSESTSKFWFDSTPEFDNIITEKYNSLLIDYNISNICENSKISKINKTLLTQIEDDYKLSISYILLHDQIPRHIYRKNQNIIEYYLNLILDFSKKIYIKYKYDFKSQHYCFVLLPLRHTNKFDNIMYVIQETKIFIKNNPLNQDYKRFLKATLERYIKLNDDKTNIIGYEPLVCPSHIQDLTQICELEILKYYPTLFKDINFLSLPINIKNLFDSVKDITLSRLMLKKGIVSLSGGVDSMILSYILKYIGIDISAIHINYNNRPECEEECNILKQWCSFLGIKLYIRKIEEIQRPEMIEYNLRDLYESYTKDVRFNTYINSTANSTDDSEPEIYHIFLGHNQDDQFENIFTNIVSESHYQNLRGMDYNMTLKFKEKNINFIRPMLDIPKSDIYKFSSYFSIPHFKDSTPKWSQRGKIRDIVRPSIEQWESKAVDSFFKLSDSLSDLIKIADMYALNITEQIKINKNFQFNLDNIFPKYLFKIIFEKLGVKMSQKGLSSFYEKLLYIKKNKQKYKMNVIEKYRLNIDVVIKWKNLSGNNILIHF